MRSGDVDAVRNKGSRWRTTTADIHSLAYLVPSLVSVAPAEASENARSLGLRCEMAEVQLQRHIEVFIMTR